LRCRALIACGIRTTRYCFKRDCVFERLERELKNANQRVRAPLITQTCGIGTARSRARTAARSINGFGLAQENFVAATRSEWAKHLRARFERGCHGRCCTGC
jgi:hypothetical protein